MQVRIAGMQRIDYEAASKEEEEKENRVETGPRSQPQGSPGARRGARISCHSWNFPSRLEASNSVTSDLSLHRWEPRSQKLVCYSVASFLISPDFISKEHLNAFHCTALCIGRCHARKRFARERTKHVPSNSPTRSSKSRSHRKCMRRLLPVREWRLDQEQSHSGRVLALG